MEEDLTMKEVAKETGRVIVKFFKRCGSNEEVFKLSKRLRHSGSKVEILGLGMEVIGAAFSYLLTVTNMAIEQKMVLLGVILFMLYQGQIVVEEAYHLFQASENEKNMLIVKDEVSLQASKIVGKVSNKVQRYNKDNGTYEVMTNEAVLNCIKKYLENVWEGTIVHKFQIVEIIGVVIMLVTAVMTNQTLPQPVFVGLLVTFCIISFFSSAYQGICGKYFYRKNKEYDNHQQVVLGDLLRVSEIAIGRDVEMRISIFQKMIKASNTNTIVYTKRKNISYLIVTLLELFSDYGLIIMYLLQIEWSSINLGTIASITANLVIVKTALSYIGRIFRTIRNYAEIITEIGEEQADIDNILNVYHLELKKKAEVKRVRDIVMPPFEIGYVEESDNDKPFTLVSNGTIEIGEGEIAILYGTSGSGKSTFMNMLTQRISLKASIDIPSTSRFMFYDEKLRFGSLSIYDELFCCSEEPDLDKMQSILESLHLWEEIGRNCYDIWTWMKQKQFGSSLSNGQKQRLILAKMLYWLDDQIDVIVLDEATSGLDDIQMVDGKAADASGILEYITRFANADRKRTVVIATHQNINPFVERMSKDGYKFRILNFVKDGGINMVKQIQ